MDIVTLYVDGKIRNINRGRNVNPPFLAPLIGIKYF